MTVRSLYIAVAVLVVAIAATGCRPNDKGAVRLGRITVEVFEYGFKPNFIEAQPGRTTFTVKNVGDLAHNFALERHGRLVGKTRTALKGTRTLTVKLETGHYTFHCTVPHHDDLGETGTLVVKGRE